MDISQVLELDKTEKIEHEWKGTKFSFDMKLAAYSPEFQQSLADTANTPIVLARMVADVVTAWTINKAGEDYPPTFENLRILPGEFLWDMVNRICEVWNGNKEDKKKSVNG